MKTTGLTFREVENRILVGICSRFRFKENRWWIVNPITGFVRRKTEKGISTWEYKRMCSAKLLDHPGYQTEIINENNRTNSP